MHAEVEQVVIDRAQIGSDQSQSAPNAPLHSSTTDTNYGDSSWPLYAMYSKIVQEEDNKTAKLHQKSADGILIFSGLYSVTVAIFLAVSLPDLKPNPQVNSEFYLANIFRLMSNASDVSIPSTLANLPAFSPPRYVVWVNSFWLLALLVSLAGVMSATIEQRCALRHMAITHNRDYSPERRARVHAVFAKSEYGRFDFRDTSAMVFCLHLSLFLFMAGFLIYFFNINRDTFYAVVWWVAFVTILYILYTVVPIFIPEELLFTPFSGLVFRLYILFLHAVSQVIRPYLGGRFHIGVRIIVHYHDLQRRYSKGFIEGKTKSAEQAASKESRSIDTEVLEKILLTLDEDRALGVFFEAIPGFCDSDLVQKPLDDGFRANLQRSLVGFLDRTFASTSVPQQVRNDRLITCLNAANSALGPRAVFQILHDFSKVHSDEELQSIVREHYWVNKGNGRRIAAYTIACTQNRGFEWTRLVTEVLGVPEDVFRMYRTEGDGPLLAILIHVTRKTLRTGHLERGVLESLSQFDVRYTPPYLQREFCTLWNEVVQEERNLKASGVPTQIIFAIRHLFTKLHPDTDAVLAPLPVFSGSIDRLQVDPTLSQRSSESYPLCPHPGHPPASSAEAATTSAHIPHYGVTVSPPSIDHAVRPEYVPSASAAAPSLAVTTASFPASPHVVTVSGQTPGVIDRTASAQDDI